jgi:CHAD domain-containing protein
VRGAIAGPVARWLRHEPGVRSGVDPEDVHQARVSIRRLRSVLRTFGDVLEPSWTKPLRDELRWFGDLLGAVRDVEVLRDGLRSRVVSMPEQDRPAAARLIATLDIRRNDARAPLLAAIGEKRYERLLDAVVDAAAAPAVFDDAAAGRARAALGPPFETLWKDLDQSIDRVVTEASNESIHTARIRSKRLRYAAEAVVPIYGKRARGVAKAAADLQDVLGTHQDAVVALAWLREVAAHSDPAEAFVAGELATLESNSARAARARWPIAWRSLSRKKLRLWA